MKNEKIKKNFVGENIYIFILFFLLSKNVKKIYERFFKFLCHFFSLHFYSIYEFFSIFIIFLSIK